MTINPQWADETETLTTAARLLRDLDVGALPIRSADDRILGMLTDRDIVVKCLASGGDPATATVGSLAQGEPVSVGPDDDIDEALEAMQEAQVRRLPVIDGNRLVAAVMRPVLELPPLLAVGAVLLPEVLLAAFFLLGTLRVRRTADRSDNIRSGIGNQG